MDATAQNVDLLEDALQDAALEIFFRKLSVIYGARSSEKMSRLSTEQVDLCQSTPLQSLNQLIEDGRSSGFEFPIVSCIREELERRIISFVRTHEELVRRNNIDLDDENSNFLANAFFTDRQITTQILVDSPSQSRVLTATETSLNQMDLLMGESETPNQVFRKVSFELGLQDEDLLQHRPITQQPKQEENLDTNQMETTVQEAQLAIRTRNDSNNVSRNYLGDYLDAGFDQLVKSGDLPTFSKENSIEGKDER